jgi:hypothetical protein
MSAELLLDLCGKLVLLPWLMLIVAPRWSWTRKLIFHAWLPMLLGVAYVFAFWHAWPFPEGGGFGSLQEIAILFRDPWLLAAGWIHYLAFDLFIGAWEVRDAERRGVNHLLVIPCLVFTFLAGPAGLLLYFIVRAITTRSLSTVEE